MYFSSQDPMSHAMRERERENACILCMTYLLLVNKRCFLHQTLIKSPSILIPCQKFLLYFSLNAYNLISYIIILNVNETKPNDLSWNCFVFLNDLLASLSRNIKIWKLINLWPRANSKTVRGKTPNRSGDEFSSRHTSSP